MIHNESLWRHLDSLGLGGWRASLQPLVDTRLAPTAHGDLPGWLQIIEQLPAATTERSRELLLRLAPWRKGPFSLNGIEIDAEWRSDMKWNRIKDAIEPLHGRNVLDVGCGNGYYALQMRNAGAASVLGIDPTPLYIVQFLAVSRFIDARGIFVLPLRLVDLPGDSRAFDTVFSMGVLYHQRSPIDHLQQLKAALRPGGQLVLETLFIPGNESYACTPADRYAKMRNVWLLPTVAELETWIRRSGFRSVQIVDESITTPDEQRSTEWMRFESLAEALDPESPDRTVEGWPAPRRVAAVAKAP